jgi:hypothetical protein
VQSFLRCSIGRRGEAHTGVKGEKSNGLDRIKEFLYIAIVSNVREHHSTFLTNLHGVESNRKLRITGFLDFFHRQVF